MPFPCVRIRLFLAGSGIQHAIPCRVCDDDAAATDRPTPPGKCHPHLRAKHCGEKAIDGRVDVELVGILLAGPASFFQRLINTSGRSQDE